MTEIYDWKNQINEEELNKCIKTIENGGIVIFPTETVYGIGTNAFIENSVKKIYEVKERPEEKALSILVKSKDEIEKYAIVSNEIERKIINNFMPGPITIILNKKENVLNHITSGKNTIGIRIPDNKIINTILNNLDVPIVAPSANISGHPSGIELNQIIDDFKNKVDICIDGGKCKISTASTIVQVIDNKPVIIRQGQITLEEIERIL